MGKSVDKNWPWLLQRLMSVAYIVFTGIVLTKSVSLISNKFILDYGEGVILNFTNILARGGTYFVDIATGPFIQGAYPPAFPFLLLLAGKLISFIPLLMLGRIISFLFGIGVFYLIYKIIKFENPTNKYALYIASLFIFSQAFTAWAPLLRVDMMAVFLSLLGIYIYKKFDGPLPMLISASIFVVAFYTKQSAMIAPAAIIICEAANNRRNLLRFASAYIGLLVSSFYVGNVITNGNLYLHLVTYMGFTPLRFSLVPVAYLIFILGHVFIFYFITKEIRKHNVFSIYSVYLLLSLASIVTIGKPGANLNYLIEPTAVLIIFAGITLRANEYTPKVSLLLIAQAVLLLLIDYKISTTFPLISDATAKIANEYVLSAGSEPILSEEPGYLASEKKEVVYEPFQMGLLGKFGLWDSKKISKLCEDKYFALAIVDWRIKEDPALYSCLNKNYKVDRQSGDTDFMILK